MKWGFSDRTYLIRLSGGFRDTLSLVPVQGSYLNNVSKNILRATPLVLTDSDWPSTRLSFTSNNEQVRFGFLLKNISSDSLLPSLLSNITRECPITFMGHCLKIAYILTLAQDRSKSFPMEFIELIVSNLLCCITFHALDHTEVWKENISRELNIYLSRGCLRYYMISPFFGDSSVSRTRKICFWLIHSRTVSCVLVFTGHCGYKNYNKWTKETKCTAQRNGIYILTPYQVVYFYLTDATKLASDLTQLLVLAFRKFIAKWCRSLDHVTLCANFLFQFSHLFIIQLQNCVGSISNLKAFWEKQS